MKLDNFAIGSSGDFDTLVFLTLLNHKMTRPQNHSMAPQ